MNPDNTHILFGPPGTGKTTELIRIVEMLLEDGIAPDQIIFMSFTRKAAYEARDRAAEKFKFHPDQLPYFRTMHSLAFHQMGMSKTGVMATGDYLKICEMLGLSITFKRVAEDGTFSQASKGDRLFFMENMSRAMRRTLREHWDIMHMEGIYFYELELLHNTLKDYKQVNQKMDFTDIIYKFIENPSVPEAKVLIIDEAQDLTPLQWELAEKIASKMDEVYIAGDDDQAIFRWAGADVDKFIAIEGSRRVLDHSYRVPQQIQDVANEIVSRIHQRVPKVWKPREGTGAVEYATALEHVDMSTGQWLLLGRNAYILQQFNDHCLRNGYVFQSDIGSPISGGTFSAIQSWNQLLKGESITGRRAKTMYESMGAKVGVAYGFKTKLEEVPDYQELTEQVLREKYGLIAKGTWEEALDRVPPHEREYFLAAMRRGETFTERPRIKISTIHGAKGGEADNVLVATDMADRTYREFQENPDDEHRVWYVAITRAKQKLHILQPTSLRSYEI